MTTSNDIANLHALSCRRRYSMARVKIAWLSRKAPRPPLHRTQSNPRTAPVLWSWSICALFRPNREVGMMISPSQIAHRPSWSESIRKRSSGVRPNLYFNFSILRCALIFSGYFAYRLFALMRSRSLICSGNIYRDLIAASRVHCLQREEYPSRADNKRPKSPSGLRSAHVGQKRPSSVTRGTRREGLRKRHLSYFRFPCSFVLSGLRLRHSFSYKAQQALHLLVWPLGVHLFGVNSSSGFVSPHFLHVNILSRFQSVNVIANVA